MKKEIKFRGKRIDDGEWAYGSYHYSKCNEHHYILNLEKFIDVDDRMKSLHKIEVVDVDPKTVGQYIGNKDCDGGEIYDGDVLCVPHLEGKKHQVRLVIEWDDERAKYTDYSPRGVFKILGNIYDNPELINN